MANEVEGFVRSVVEKPDDDTVRLAYADWLDENDNGSNKYAQRAAFIRNQIALYNTGYKHTSQVYVFGWDDSEAADETRAFNALFAKNEELSRGITDTWAWPFGIPGDPGIQSTWSRGFISGVKCAAEAFIRWGDHMVWHPGQLSPVPEKCQKCWCGYLEDQETHMLTEEKCPDCKGTAKVSAQRPCPASVHPIRKVDLITPMLMERRDPNTCYRVPAREKWWTYLEVLTEAGGHAGIGDTSRLTEHALHRDIWMPALWRLEWPGITFTWPQR